jgi:very-short-patch-repair endonuclease
MSHLVDALLTQIKIVGLPEPETEVRFLEGRRFAFDLAWRDRKLAAECEGGTYSGGRHTRPAGYERDCEKYSLAAIAGWRVLRFTGRMIGDGRAIDLIERAMKENAA